MTRLKGLLIIPTLLMHIRAAKWGKFGHKILGYNKYGKENLLEVGKALQDTKTYIGTLKLKNATQKSGLKYSNLKPDQKISRLKKLR